MARKSLRAIWEDEVMGVIRKEQTAGRPIRAKLPLKKLAAVYKNAEHIFLPLFGPLVSQFKRRIQPNSLLKIASRTVRAVEIIPTAD